MPENITDPSESWYYTESDQEVQRSKEHEALAQQARESELTTIDGEPLDPYSIPALQHAQKELAEEEAVEALTEAKKLEQEQRSPESLKGHSGFDRLSLDQQFNEEEIPNPNDPRWKHIYDSNRDGIVDWKDNWPKLEEAGVGFLNMLTNPMRFGMGMVGQGTRNLAGERKHAFTAGTGNEDFETNLREAINVWRGIPHQLVDSIVTFPESKARSWLLGENLAEQDLYFDPDKILGVDEPWTGTRWGNLAETLGGWIRGVKATHGLLSGVGGYSKLTRLSNIKGTSATAIKTRRGARLAQEMIREGLWMQASSIRQDGTLVNLAQEGLRKIHPSLADGLNWIATGEYDHPAVKELKATLETLGAPLLFAGLWGAAVSGKNHLKGQFFKPTTKRLQPIPGTHGRPEIDELGRIIDSQLDQADAMGKKQLDDVASRPIEQPIDGSPSKNIFRADMNRPIADAWQGAHTSVGMVRSILKQLDMLEDLPSGYGTTDSPISALDAERAAFNSAAQSELLQKAAKDLLGDSYYQGLLKDVGNNTGAFNQVFTNSLRRFQEMVGRDSGSLSARQFWEPILRDFGDASSYQKWAIENVVASDLINGALFKDLRSKARTAREIGQVADVLSPDGPMKSIADRLIFGLTNVKRARFLVSKELADLNAVQRAKAIADRTQALHDETVDGVRLMMQFLKDSDSEELAQGILEVFSMSNKIQNWKDFDAWVRQKIRGGDFAGHHKEGLLMKELGGVMTNSILSGPKTPIRAIMGTTANAYLNEVTTLLGAGMRSIGPNADKATLRSSAASTKAMFTLIPEAFQIFRTNLDSYFSGDIATIRSRFSEYTKNDENWDLLGQWAERNGTSGDKAAYYMANTARQLNSNSFLTWSSRVMGATDDTFRWLLSRSRARKKALLTVMKENPTIEITPEMLRKAEDIEFRNLHDAEGNIDITKDAFLAKNYREVTLTTELQGFSKGLETLMNRYPLTKPFFLFARTGINGLKLSVKNLPVVGAIVDESRAILGAGDAQLKDGSLLKYGIENADDLASAKSMVLGRQAVGTAIVSMAAHKYMSGGLTGNGPADATMRKMWIDAGWNPRSINIGGVWVSYDAMEPWNLALANIADVGDNMALMGPQFSEERLQLVVAALGKGATSKTYLQGVGQLFDLLSGNAGQASGRIVGNLVNNQMPLAGLRNEIGNIINPQMRELNADLFTHIANRNPIFKGTLPVRYDMLNGKPVRPWNFFEASFNAISPVALRMERGPGRKMLFESGYDSRIAAFSAPDGTSLRDSPKARSLYQQAIGNTNLEAELNRLASLPNVQASLAAMREDQKNGNFDLNPMKAYLHNQLIRKAFDKHTRRAWASLRNNPIIIELKAQQLGRSVNNSNRLRETRNLLRTPK